tara:strand:+ start:107 stop:478 length:372 start_codon:yes stop_codon:yes gene_type:complete
LQHDKLRHDVRPSQFAAREGDCASPALREGVQCGKCRYSERQIRQTERSQMSMFRSQLKKSLNVQSETLRPLWIRVVLVAICAVWAVFELLVAQSVLWALLAVAIGAYLFHQFFIAFAPPPRR